MSLSPFRKHCLEIGFVERYFNPTSVRELRASEVRDPKHRSPIGGVAVDEKYHDYDAWEGYLAEGGTFEGGAGVGAEETNTYPYRRIRN